jgi:uncharacterized membrane protein YfcA
MIHILLLAVTILLIAFFMTMTGRGGGNFYMLALVISGVSMNVAASTGQFILMCSSLSAAILFSKQKMNDWRLTVILGILVFVSAIAGGYFGDCFDEKVLKLIFGIAMLLAAFFMLKKPKQQQRSDKFWVIQLKPKNPEDDFYQLNLLTTVPIVLLTGFVSGMVGVSGGTFLVPLMLLTMSVPMHRAVGTSTTLVTVSAAAGFLGHLGAGYFDIGLAIPLAISGIIGGFAGAKVALKSKPKNLKFLFAGTQVVAAIIMIIKVFS